MDEKRVGIRVLVCHQNQLFAECLATALSNEEDFEALSMDWRTADFGAAFASVQPTILLVDADLPNNLAVDMVHELQRQLEHGKAVMVVSTGNEHTYIDCLRAGAAGYVQDSESLADLKRSLEIVQSGQTYCSPQIVNTMFATFGELAKQNRWLQHFRATGLTLRELEILRLIADNRLSNKQIARQLSISMYTVKNHVHNILEKLDAQDRHDAVEIARQRHLLKVVS